MCTYVTTTTEIEGSALGPQGWFDVDHAVVYFDHPQDAALEHALSIDFRQRNADPSTHVAVELDAQSARLLARAILEALDLVSDTAHDRPVGSKGAP